MRLDKKEIAGLALIGVGTGLITYRILTWFEERGELTKLEKMHEREHAKEIIQDMGYCLNTLYPQHDSPNDLHVDIYVPMDHRGDPTEEIVVPDDGKPDMSTLISEMQEKNTDPYVPADPRQNVVVVDTEAGEDIYQSLPQNTVYMTERVDFDEDGTPAFKDEDFDSEGDEHIYLIPKSDYEGNDHRREKQVAVWFEKSGVLVDSNLKPIEVVDTVGPSAFTVLFHMQDETIYVRNEELATDYELSMNKTATIEEAWAEQEE